MFVKKSLNPLDLSFMTGYIKNKNGKTTFPNEIMHFSWQLENNMQKCNSYPQNKLYNSQEAKYSGFLSTQYFDSILETIH